MSRARKPEPQPSALTRDAAMNVYLALLKHEVDDLAFERQSHWRVTLAFWAGIGVATGFLAGKMQLGWLHLAFYGLLWGVYVFCWAIPYERDTRWIMWNCDHYRTVLANLLGGEYPYVPCLPFEKQVVMRNIYRIGEVLLTTLLLFMSWYILHVVPPAS